MTLVAEKIKQIKENHGVDLLELFMDKDQKSDCKNCGAGTECHDNCNDCGYDR